MKDLVPWLHDLPTRRLLLTAEAAEPIALPARAGATVGTTLHGVLGPGLRATCPDHHPGCTCALAVLSPRRCGVLLRDITPGLRCHAEALEQGAAATFTLDLRLLGAAAAHAGQVVDAWEEAGRLGLITPAGAMPFVLTEVDLGPPLPLHTTAGAPVPLRLASPAISRRPLDSAAAFTHAVGEAAYDAVAFALFEAAPPLDRPARDALASSARAAATAEAPTGRCELRQVDLGLRRSRSNGHSFPLRGWMGDVALQSPPGTWPWWALTRWFGVGQDRALGFGRVADL